MRDTCEPSAEPLGLTHVCSPHENGTTGLVELPYVRDHCILLLTHSVEDKVWIVYSDHRAIGWDDFNVKSIDRIKFVSLRGCGAGQSAHFGIEIGEILDGDRAKGLALLLDCHTLLHLNRRL